MEFPSGKRFLKDESRAGNGWHGRPLQAAMLDREMANKLQARLMNPADFRKVKRYDLPGYGRELTFSCFQRRPFFKSDRSRGWVVEAIRRARESHGFQLWAWVVMPEHVHMLVFPDRKSPEVGPILKTVKQSVSRVAIDYVRMHAPEKMHLFADRSPSGKVAYRVWQRGAGYDRNLYTTAAIWNSIEYIHANPVRRGLCEHSLDWKWSGARALTLGEALPIPLDRTSLPPFEG